MRTVVGRTKHLTESSKAQVGTKTLEKSSPIQPWTWRFSHHKASREQQHWDFSWHLLPHSCRFTSHLPLPHARLQRSSSAFCREAKATFRKPSPVPGHVPLATHKFIALQSSSRNESTSTGTGVRVFLPHTKLILVSQSCPFSFISLPGTRKLSLVKLHQLQTQATLHRRFKVFYHPRATHKILLLLWQAETVEKESRGKMLLKAEPLGRGEKWQHQILPDTMRNGAYRTPLVSKKQLWVFSLDTLVSFQFNTKQLQTWRTNPLERRCSTRCLLPTLKSIGCFPESRNSVNKQAFSEGCTLYPPITHQNRGWLAIIQFHHQKTKRHTFGR